MFDLVNERFIFMVAQAPFEAMRRDSWETNTFCTLRPLLTLDGEPVDPTEFPNCGLVWWMVRAGSSGFAEPGRLVVASLERAIRWDDHDPLSMMYQVNVNTVEPVRTAQGCEVITVPSNVANGIDDLVNRRDVLRLDHAPTSAVYIRLKERVYGPFRAAATATDMGAYQISVTPETADTVFELDEGTFSSSYSKDVRTLRSVITRESENPALPGVATRQITVEFLLREGVDRLKRSAHPTVKLTSDETALRSLAKDILPSRKVRQEFSRLLEDVVGSARERGETGLRLDAALRILDRQKSELDALESVADGILKSGLLNEALERQYENARNRYIEKNAAELFAEAQSKAADEERRLAELSRQREQEESDFSAFRARREAEFETELAEKARVATADMQHRELELQRLQRELDQQREVVGRQLTGLVERFSSGRDELIQNFLAMKPLLEEIGLDSLTARNPEPSQSGASPSKEAPAIIVPEDSEDDAPPVEEQDFFKRFVDVVAAQGFKYRPIDLVNFHIATKTNDITILGGYSGTGKSSLVDLYARALAGSTAPQHNRFLQVWVSPSWLDTKDLLGHVNALSRTFQPSESRLFEYVAQAQEEWDQRGANSGVYLICLDEMNLAQVEHYFGAFIQALPSASRQVPVFDRGSVDAASPYRRFSVLRLSPALRFVGTVNFDETTRQLSSRLLDRADLIRLGSPEMSEMTRSGERTMEVRELGSPVRIRDMQAWAAGEGALKPDLARVLDDLRPHLETLGCPLTPRRFRSIRRFVTSAGTLCTQHEAFDLQISNRILPQIRNVITAQARRALDEVRQVLERRQLEGSLHVLESSLNDVVTEGLM